MTIQGHADLPGSREHLRVLDRGFVQHGIGSDERVAFDHVQAVAREIPRAVEPRLAVEAGHIDDERVAVPAPARLPHPRIDGSRFQLGHADHARGARKFIADQDRRGSLDDLKWKGLVCGARHSRQITLDLRVRGHPLLEVLFLPGQRRRPIRNLVALHHAESGGHCADRAEVRTSRLRGVGLKIPVCRVLGLPDAVQVGLAIGCARDGERTRLSRGRAHRGRKDSTCSDRRNRDQPASEPVLHWGGDLS